MAPNLDLRGFNGLVDQSEINNADATLNGSVEKWLHLADHLLFPGSGEKHLFYGFYFELPFPLILEMQSFNWFRLSCYDEGLVVKGIVTAPLDQWKLFIAQDASEMMQKLVSAIAKLLPLKVK